LSRKPQEVTLPDPLTGIPRTFTVTRDGVIAQVFTSLYSPNMVAVLPSAITQAAQGNYLPMAALTAGTVANLEDKMAFGMRLSVTCAEDVPRIDAAARSAAAEKQPFGNYFIDEFSAACEVWPKGKVKPDFHTPLQSDVPVLIFSGGLDPVTPPSFGDEVKKGFRNSLHVVAPNVGHGVSNFGCAPRLIKQFIEKASVEGLDGECLKRIPRPTFYEPMQSKPRADSKDAKSAIAVGVPQ
jgi:pimeloyl-ACP methyl ester carboxylesterase